MSAIASSDLCLNGKIIVVQSLEKYYVVLEGYDEMYLYLLTYLLTYYSMEQSPS
jgi:hypothetical protein